MKPDKFQDAYKKCLINQSYVDIDTSMYTFKDDVKCPKCGSVHVNIEDNNNFYEDKQIITYSCGDCNCSFQCTFRPVVIDIKIQEE